MHSSRTPTLHVGSAPQDPELREKFRGKPEHVVNFFFLLAADIRRHMAQLGFRTFQEMIGRTDRLRFAPHALNGKARQLDLSGLLTSAADLRPDASTVGGSVRQQFDLDSRMVSAPQTRPRRLRSPRRSLTPD